MDGFKLPWIFSYLFLLSVDDSISAFAAFFGVLIGITSSSLIDSYINHESKIKIKNQKSWNFSGIDFLIMVDINWERCKKMGYCGWMKNS